MPGISFLFKKKWHPASASNEKRLFIAEQEAEQQKQRDEEARLEVVKEVEVRRMEELDGIGKRDPRTTSLKFMYSLPDKAQSAPSTSSHRHNDVDEDDIMVKRFRDKLSGHSQEIESEHKSQSEDRPGDLLHHTNMTPEEYSKLHELKSKSSFGASAKQSLLERSVGRKHLYGLSQTELEERHPRLKNAPIEGAYARNVEIKHKPFHDVIRNVKCTRCKEWGHQSGDRECMLKDFNPHDVARQHREDPLTYINNNLVLEKQRLVLKHASGMSSENQQLLLDEDDESDPEADYLATLTSHEKRLLLRRLDEMSSGLPITKAGYSSSSGDSDSSYSNESKSSKSRRRKKRNRHAKKKSKKAK